MPALKTVVPSIAKDMSDQNLLNLAEDMAAVVGGKVMANYAMLKILRQVNKSNMFPVTITIAISGDIEMTIITNKPRFYKGDKIRFAGKKRYGWVLTATDKPVYQFDRSCYSQPGEWSYLIGASERAPGGAIWYSEVSLLPVKRRG